MAAVRRQAGMVDTGDGRVRLERGRDGERRGALPGYPKRQGGEPAVQQGGIVG